jgi:hypothetical protein
MTILQRILSTVLEVVGAVVGGAAGFFAFGWMYERGYYAGMLPAGLLGLGCAAMARQPSLGRGILCGIAGLALSLFAESWYRYFNGHPSVEYFFNHLQDVSQVDWAFISVGTLLAFWIGKDARFHRASRPADGPR